MMTVKCTAIFCVFVIEKKLIFTWKKMLPMFVLFFVKWPINRFVVLDYGALEDLVTIYHN